MATLKELSEISGVQTPRTIGEQVYSDQQINNQYSDTAPGDFGYTGNMQKNNQFYDPFHSNFQRLTQPLSNTFNKYAPQIAGGIMSLASGIPGLGMIMNMLPKNNPQNQFMLDSYGGYGDMGRQDKFGYNVVSQFDNYMQPGSNSFRSHAYENLMGLDQNIANDFYQQNYGKTFDEVKSDIQSRQDPFNQTIDAGSGADYYGGNDDNNNNNSGSFGSSVNDNSNFSDYS